MKIGMVLGGHEFPPDVRVEREARALRDAGHVVDIICDGHCTSLGQDQWEGMRIYRVPHPSRVPLAIRKANTLLRGLTFVDVYWWRVLCRLVGERNYDVLHVHDLPLLRTALLVRRRRSCAVVVDLHENYPDALQYYVSSTTRLTRYFNDTDRWRRYESRDVPRADQIIVVVDEMRTRLERSGVPAGRIRVLENVVDLDALASVHLDPSVLDTFRPGSVMLYAGSIGRQRGLDGAIRAVASLIDDVPDLHFVIVGRGNGLAELRELVSGLGLDHHVHFLGWRDWEESIAFMAASDVCVLPLLRTVQTDHSSPNKLFEYMAVGRPTLASSCPSVVRIIEETGAGLVFEAGNPASLAAGLLRLQDPALRTRLGESGAHAVRSTYNWQHASGALVDVYRELADR